MRSGIDLWGAGARAPGGAIEISPLSVSAPCVAAAFEWLKL